ncbi:MAG: hypothetical protein IPL65_11465 [Lewinellaceae bacterium]|nr:hypothetical protein [Lewinellaceae bacterium]
MYRIHIDGELKYKAATKLFRWMPEINLFRADDDTPIFTLNRKLTLVSISFDIKKQDGQRLEFRTISFWKLHYECRDGKDKYEIFGHRGRKYSIYKNTVQVAWWDKEGVTWFEGDNYKITADSDADAELLSCFCLIIDKITTAMHSRSTWGTLVRKPGNSTIAGNPNHQQHNTKRLPPTLWHPGRGDYPPLFIAVGQSE